MWIIKKKKATIFNAYVEKKCLLYLTHQGLLQATSSYAPRRATLRPS